MMKSYGLVLLNTQMDYCEGGRAHVEGAGNMVKKIAQFIKLSRPALEHVILVLDQHPFRHVSFASAWTAQGVALEPGDLVHGSEGHFYHHDHLATCLIDDPQGLPDHFHLKPDHCVKGSIGACIHPDILEAIKGLTVTVLVKGTQPNVCERSAVTWERLQENVSSPLLQATKNLDSVWYITGLAIMHAIDKTFTDMHAVGRSVMKIGNGADSVSFHDIVHRGGEHERKMEHTRKTMQMVNTFVKKYRVKEPALKGQYMHVRMDGSDARDETSDLLWISPNAYYRACSNAAGTEDYPVDPLSATFYFTYLQAERKSCMVQDGLFTDSFSIPPSVDMFTTELQAVDGRGPYDYYGPNHVVAMVHEGVFHVKMNPDGTTRDFVDYDSNLIAVAAGVATAEQAALVLRRIDGGRCAHDAVACYWISVL